MTHCMPAGKNVSLKNGINAINTSLDVVSETEQHVLVASTVATNDVPDLFAWCIR